MSQHYSTFAKGKVLRNKTYKRLSLHVIPWYSRACGRNHWKTESALIYTDLEGMLPFKERELFIILTFNGDYLLAASLPASPYRLVVTFSSLNCTSGQARCGISQWKQCERPGSLASPPKERLLATVEVLLRMFGRRSDEVKGMLLVIPSSCEGERKGEESN